MTGYELRRARLRLDLEQKELGEKLDVRANTISRYENGTLKIPKAIELSVKYLELIESIEEKTKS